MPKYTPSASQPELPFDKIPFGHCRCGCGQKTNIATRTRAEAGWIRGQPQPCIYGHNTLRLAPMVEPNPSGLCLCGCGQPTPIAKVNRRDIGHVKGKPIKYILGHLLVQGRTTLAESFRFHCTEGAPDACWEWQGYRNVQGYGAIHFNVQQYAAHRVAYELHYGPIPEGLEVCHECDNPPCCNWAHLFVGAHAVNAADMVSKNRQARGERIGNARLTDAIVLEIRRLCSLSTERGTQAAVAQQLGISPSLVSNVVLRKRWAHVTEEH